MTPEIVPILSELRRVAKAGQSIEAAFQCDGGSVSEVNRAGSIEANLFVRFGAYVAARAEESLVRQLP